MSKLLKIIIVFLSNFRRNSFTASQDPYHPEYTWDFEDLSPKPEHYFNYDSNSQYGPQHWQNLEGNNEFFWWVLENTNQCLGTEQSPVNVDEGAACREDHKINTRRGSHSFNTIEWKILPHALRANLSVDYVGKTSARIDVSNLSNWIPAIFVEVKIPSEHSLFGQFYPGEFVISHFFDKDSGYFVNISIMMEITYEENLKLEQFIREWEEIAWKRQADCNGYAYFRTYPVLDLAQMRQIWGEDKSWRSDYDLYAFLTTMFHCGYDGSLTVPPCLERVHWRVLDLPMGMSESQYFRIRDLLINQLDSHCERSTVAHSHNGVARPLQYNDSRMYCCRCGDFKMNEEDKWRYLGKWPDYYHGNSCF